MTQITVGTFNVENLFLRYMPLNDPNSQTKNPKFDPDNMTVNSFKRVIDEMGPIGDALRKFTGQVIDAGAADILAVQEVENLEALDQFNRHHIKKPYPYLLVLDGNDPRQIDVGILSRFDLFKIRTHRFEPKGAAPTRRIFARDCLEISLEPAPGKLLTLYINHFTSKLPKKDAKTGEIHHGETRRLQQSKRLSEILRANHGPNLVGDWIVMGDLNAAPNESELAELMNTGAVNLVGKLTNPNERWTHFFDRAPKTQSPIEQLDYLLISPELAAKNMNAVPAIERRGLSDKIVTRINAAVPTFGPKITGNFTKGAKGEASDHCGVFVSLTL